MLKLNLIAPMVHGTSGYANHARGLLNALSQIADVKLSCGLPQGWERQTNDAELLAITREDSNDRINVIIDMPQNWPLYLNKKKNVTYVIWEGDRCPKSWIENFKDERVNLIFVPSEHTRTAIKNTTNDLEIIKKVRIVPHGANRDAFYPTEKKDNVFRFIINKGFRHSLDRGGTQHAITAYTSEFRDEPVELLIHMNIAYCMNPEIFNLYLNSLGYQGKPKISASWDNLDQKQLNELYNLGDVFLAPSEAESFSIPCLEAMACGKMVLSNGYGGQTDFIKDGQNGLLTKYTLHPVLHELSYEGTSWGRPDIDDLKKKMRWCFENRDKIQEMGLNALKDSKDLTWANSAETLIQHLKDL